MFTKNKGWTEVCVTDLAFHKNACQHPTMPKQSSTSRSACEEVSGRVLAGAGQELVTLRSLAKWKDRMVRPCAW